MFYETLISAKLAINNLRTNIGRTVLTLVGVVIGVTAVIVVMSSGQGVKSFVLGQVASFGTDVIQVEVKVPATGKTSTQNATSQVQGVTITTMKIEDAKAVARLSNVESVYAGTIGQEIISYQDVKKRIVMFGAGAEVPVVDPGVKISDGEFYSEGDDNALAQVVVIGPKVKETFFGEDDAIGKNVRIRGQNYRIVGTLEPRGTVGFFDFDSVVYVPVQTLEKKILGVDYIRFFTVKTKDESLVDATADDITKFMRERHEIDNPEKDDFSVTSIKEAQDLIGTVFGAVNILLLALTSISLLVGGVGIMNVMYVAVAERTFEIGLRKSVGAKASDILKQFLWEAIFITLTGGVVGILLGYLLSLFISYAFSALGYDLKFVITPSAVLLAAGFSAAVGVIFGYYPARRASLLSPMEALRRE